MALAGSPDGRRFTAAYLDGTASVFEAETGNEIAWLDSGQKIASAPTFGSGSIFFDAEVQYSSDNQYIVVRHEVLTADNEIQIQIAVWDAEFSSLLRTETLDYGSHFVQLAHPAIARCARDGSVTLVDVCSNREFLALGGTGERVRAVTGTPDGRFLYTRTDTSVHEWDLKNKTHRKIFRDPELRPVEMKMSPEGKYLILVAQAQVEWMGKRLFVLTPGP